jgi:hypothetical protein
VPNQGEKWLGVAVEQLSEFLTFQTDAELSPLGQPGTTGQVALYEYYLDWGEDFNQGKVEDAYHNGMAPLITWEPWEAHAIEECEYQLCRIARGDFDTYIASFAADAAAWPHPIFLRFAHEMNGNWYPWAEAVNCNRRGDYKRAWRHVHNKFADVYRDLGTASNVNWVWAPNVKYDSTPLQGLYPGRRYVDWVGLDGYNFGNPWKSFFEVFNDTITELSPILAHHPLMITETACTEDRAPAGESKATWITDFFNELINGPWASGISAFVWFNIDKSPEPWEGENWTIQSSDPVTGAQDAKAAFVAGLHNANLVLGQACF